MKTIKMTLVGAVTWAVLGAAVPAMPAFAADFSFNVGDVQLGYNDGYWDTKHQWHAWKNANESREYQKQHKERFVSDNHTNYKNEGWRDKDGDGVPDKLDKRPNDPKRN